MAYEHPNHQYNHHPPYANYPTRIISGPPHVTEPTYPHHGPSSAGTLPTYAHGHPHYANDQYNEYSDIQPGHSPSMLHPYTLPSHAPARPYYIPSEQYQDVMQRPYIQTYIPQDPHNHQAQYSMGMAYTAQSPVVQQPNQPQETTYPQQNMPSQTNRGYFQQDTLDKLHMHPYAHRAIVTTQSHPASAGTGLPPVQPEPHTLERPANSYPFKPTVPGPLTGPILAPELQQSLAYSKSPASSLPSTLPAVPSTSGPASSRQSDSTGSLSPRTNQDNSLPAPVFSSTSPVTNRADVLLGDPSVRNRKFVVERDIECIKCSWVIGRLLLRGTQEEFEHEYSLYFQCPRCHNAPALPVVSRKRTRTTEDTSSATMCDVCHRARGIGGVVMKDREVSVPYAIEIVCISCSSRYSRCSDCGGGSGRVGVGKWRCKEMSGSIAHDVGRVSLNAYFPVGSKGIARLAGSLTRESWLLDRLGHGELEIGVWRAPEELKSQKDLLSVIASCKKLWQERVLAKLATPEVLEGDQEQPLRTYQDIDDVLARGWPAHENLLLEFPPAAGLHKRYICLLWTKSKGRRNRKPNPNPGPVNADDPNQLAEGLRRAHDFAPEGCTLVAIFMCDWDMMNGTVLVSTSVPFESQDAEDRGAVSMGEVLGQILKDRAEHNTNHPDNPVPAPLHLWVGIKAVSPLHGARFIDSMNRRGFILLSEYVARHPDVDANIFSEPPFGHLWLDDPWATTEQNDTRPVEILVRWLGKDLDEAQLEKLKGIEYGKRARETGRAKKRR